MSETFGRTNTCFRCQDELHMFILAVDLGVPSDVTFNQNKFNEKKFS